MKKQTPTPDPDMLEEYDFSKGVRGKYVERFKDGRNRIAVMKKGAKMTFQTSPNLVLNKVADSLVAAKRYATTEEALWDMAVSTVRGKVSYYRRRIRKMENKYGVDFDKFTARLKGSAKPAQEDDWLAWRSARSMLADWQKTYQDLLHATPRQ